MNNNTNQGDAMSNKIEDQTRLNYVQDKVQRDFDMCLGDLERDAKRMIDTMENLIQNVQRARDGEPFTINSLGVAKWTGDDIDVNAAKLRQIQDQMQMLKWIKEDDHV